MFVLISLCAIAIASAGGGCCHHRDPAAARPPRQVFTGEVVAISKVPSAFNIRPYRECLTVVKYQRIDGDSEEIFVVHWGMRDLAFTEAASFPPGQRHRLICDDFDSHAELRGYPLINSFPSSADAKLLMALRWELAPGVPVRPPSQ